MDSEFNRVFTEGCDPELVFVKDEEFIPADSIIGQREIELGFGTDGRRETGEIRPGFSNDIRELVGKIERILQEGNKVFNLKRFDWYAGHFKYEKGLGAHVHLAFPQIGIGEIVDTKTKDAQDVYSRQGNFIKFLDYFMVFMFENRIAPLYERDQRRKIFGYGGVYSLGEKGGYEVKSRNRIEYRPPGSWIVSPVLSYMYLFIAKAATVQFYHGDRVWNYPSASRMKSEKNMKELLLKMCFDAVKKEPTPDMKLGLEILGENIDLFPDWNAEVREAWNI